MVLRWSLSLLDHSPWVVTMVSQTNGLNTL
jgi:hypothetical protein